MSGHKWAAILTVVALVLVWLQGHFTHHMATFNQVFPMFSYGWIGYGIGRMVAEGAANDKRRAEEVRRSIADSDAAYDKRRAEEATRIIADSEAGR